MKLRTKRVQWGTIAITVREESGLDTLKEPQLFWRVIEAIYGDTITNSSQLEPYDNLRINRLVVMISRSSLIEGDLGINWPHPESSLEALKDAYHGLDTIAGGLVRKWYDAILEVSLEPMGDPDLAPPDTLSTKKKETQESDKNEAILEST